MTAQHEKTLPEQACEPEWVALNHLFSYCTKAGRAPLQGSTEPACEPEGSACARKRCLFRVPRG